MRSGGGLRRAVDPPLPLFLLLCVWGQMQVQQLQQQHCAARWATRSAVEAVGRCSALSPALTQDPLSGGGDDDRGDAVLCKA